jgi:branched-chain amino acid transport system ATP-binding protein
VCLPETVGKDMLTTDSLTKRFGNLVAVDSVSTTVQEGNFCSLIGPNGAGKTTFFNLLTGSLRPTEGTIRLGDRDVTGLAPHEIARMGCSRSFQITSIFPELTVHENLRVMAQVNSESRASMLRHKRTLLEPSDRAHELIETLGLEEVRDREARDLSHGQKRNLEIGLTLATDPTLLLLDEPTAGMSQEETAETVDLLDEIKDQFTVLLVEHDMDVVMSLSDRIMVLHHGSIIADGTPEEIRDDERVREAYLGVEGTYV